jgi:putative hydrolase of the HAD superfamily
MQHIKAIIFDLGGVLLNIDYHRAEKAFRDLGVSHFGDLYTQTHVGALFADLETGRIDGPTFTEAMKKESSVPLTDQQITDAWNAMLLDFPAERIDLLRRIQDKYDLYLLSNTNAIHLEAFTRMLQQENGVPSLDSLFRKAYYSHLIGERKPDVEAFTHVINDSHLDPATTLFIDDTAVNIDAARKAGLQAVLLTPPQTVVDVISALG